MINFFQTRKQSLTGINDARYINILKKMSSEGKLRLLKGMPAVIFGAAPAHALYYSTYEFIKKIGSSQGYQNYVVNGKFK